MAWSAWDYVQNITGYTQTTVIAEYVDKNNNLHVWWSGTDASYPSTYNVKYSRSTDNGANWSSYSLFNTAVYKGKGTVAVDSSDKMHFIYGVNSTGALKYATSTDWGANWSNINNIPTSSGTQMDPSLAIDSNDYLHLVWSGASSGDTTYEIKYSKSTDGGSNWSSINVLTSTSSHQYTPSLAIDSNDYLHVTWAGANTGSYNEIVHKVSTDSGSNWSSNNYIFSNSYHQSSPKIQITSDDKLHVAWTGSNGDDGGTALTTYANEVTVSPDGTKLIIGGPFSGCAKLYTISGDNITYVSDIYADNSSTPINYQVYDIKFTSDSTKFILTGAFTGYAKLYTISGTTVTYVSDIYADNSSTALDNICYSVAFYKDDSGFLLGGNFTGYGKVYTLSGTTVTYIDDIYADAAETPTALNNRIYDIKINSDDTAAIIGGVFTGYLKTYSISGTTVTFANTYSPGGTNVRDIDIAHDDSKFIAAGDCSGRARLYTLSGTTATYIDNIYADNSSTALSGTAYKVQFTSDSTKFILGGSFNGRGKLYTISGTTVTYIDDIPQDIFDNPLNNYVSAINIYNSNSRFILCGNFTAKAKFYSLSGTTVTFLNLIYSSSIGKSVRYSYSTNNGTTWSTQARISELGNFRDDISFKRVGDRLFLLYVESSENLNRLLIYESGSWLDSILLPELGINYYGLVVNNSGIGCAFGIKSTSDNQLYFTISDALFVSSTSRLKKYDLVTETWVAHNLKSYSGSAWVSHLLKRYSGGSWS